MPKRCIICDEEAEFLIKGTRDYYCRECAEDNFADISVLIRVEEAAKKIKELVENKSKAPQEEELGINDEP